MSKRCIRDPVHLTRIQTRLRITSVCWKVFMNILHFLSNLFYDVVSCFAAMEFGQAACCLASLNPLQTVIYAGTRTAPCHRASCHQGAGQQNGTKLFDAACNYTRHRIWCGRKQQPTRQCGGQPQTSGYRGFREDASLFLQQRITD